MLVIQPALLERKPNDLSPAAEPEFFADSHLVGFDGFDAQLQFCGNFLVAEAPGEANQDIALAVAQSAG